MNFIGKGICGDSGGSTGGRIHHQHGGEGGNSFEDDDEEEIRQITGPAGQLFPSSSSSSPSSPHHHRQQQLSYHPNHPHGGWMHGSIEPSAASRLTDYSSISIPPPPDADNNNNNNINDNNDDEQSERGMMMVVEREHMFDKVVTPSDVGKLNRLVIPKQHAERYFPLDSSNNDKGLLLNFEDRNGKPWRFRYSYWNSSQSYVMTKGWSRFVKDKKLDAGDIVSFQRGVGGSAKDRLFIDWRHRPDAPPPPYQFSLPAHHQFNFNRSNIHHPWSPLFLQSQHPAPSRSTIHSNLMLQPSNSYRYGGPYHNIGTGSVVNVNQGGSGSGSVIYFRSGGIPQQHVDMMQMHQRSGFMDPPTLPPPPPPPSSSSVVFESVPVVHGKAAPKRLRLFGVNMDCPISDDDDQDDEQVSDQLPPTTTMVSDSFTAANSGPSASFSTIPYQQLRPYEEETHETTTMSSSSTDPLNKTTKSSSSRMSLDFGI